MKPLGVSARGPQVFCYMTSWSQKRPGAGKFTPENVDPLLCTHVIYAFATLKDHKLAATDEKDIEMYDRVIALREKNPNLKVIITVNILNNAQTSPSLSFSRSFQTLCHSPRPCMTFVTFDYSLQVFVSPPRNPQDEGPPLVSFLDC